MKQIFNNMNLKKLTEIDTSSIRDERPLAEVIEEETNKFLSTRKGLSYLCMRYPNFSLKQAINDYKVQAYYAEHYC